MQTTLGILPKIRSYSRAAHKKPVRSLSSYFPEGTAYFYGYPAGDAAGFVNYVPPTVEELVAARAFGCAGPNVCVVSFAATCAPAIDAALLQALDIPTLPASQTIMLPKAIDISLAGQARNEAVKTALAATTSPGSLVMAQPFIDPTLTHHYQISSTISSRLNDKDALPSYIDESLIPTRYATYANGDLFIAACDLHPLPFVAKASSSSAGDGVHICRTGDDLKRAITKLGGLQATIIVEQFIEAKKNFGIHFGIPYDTTKPIDIIGVNEQFTSPAGEFLGGSIESAEIPKQLWQVARYLRYEALPKIRDMGWHGVGGFDVLLDADDRPYFIDCNLRMTGMTAYHFLAAANKITTPLISFSGSFTGSKQAFEQATLPLAGITANRRILQLIALNHHNGTWNFNAALMLPNQVSQTKLIQRVLNAGIQSTGLSQLLS